MNKLIKKVFGFLFFKKVVIKRYYSVAPKLYIDRSHMHFEHNLLNYTFCKFEIVYKFGLEDEDMCILVAETDGEYARPGNIISDSVSFSTLFQRENEWINNENNIIDPLDYVNSLSPENNKIFIDKVKNWELCINRDRKIDEILKNK